MTDDKKYTDINIPKPVFFKDNVSISAYKTDDKKAPVPISMFRKTIQSYWDAKHLYYIHKWLDKLPKELFAAQEDKSLSTAELLIVKFLAVSLNNPHPGLLKMIMEMSAGRSALKEMDNEEKEEGSKTIKRIILELPKSKRVDNS